MKGTRRVSRAAAQGFRLVAGLVVLAACHGDPPPKRAQAADLEIQKMPVATAPPAPVAVAAPKVDAWTGTCGDHSAGNPAPPLGAARSSGNVTLLYFWATWCGPCQQDFPAYQDIYAKNKARGLDVVAVSVDDERDGVAAFAKQHNATFTVGWDRDHKDAQCWHLDSLPSTFIIDRSGIIRFAHEGASSGLDEKVAEEIESLL